ncbi:response regulator [Roseateles puraquae]|uniref:response regulator n=1 Tax=Roseateles puraquae TaxID=431059 RepID=UPI0031DBABAF
MTDIDARPVLRTLFVEDNAELREQIGELLAEEGLAVVDCDCAEDALRLYATQRFDLVITDVSLPQMSGIDLARAILRAQPGAWVVFLSGYALGENLSTFGPHVRALLKPFELEQLQALVEAVRASCSLRA